jgi:hypothetical protein
MMTNVSFRVFVLLLDCFDCSKRRQVGETFRSSGIQKSKRVTVCSPVLKAMDGHTKTTPYAKIRDRRFGGDGLKAKMEGNGAGSRKK